jgi:hypothetical protein
MRAPDEDGEQEESPSTGHAGAMASSWESVKKALTKERSAADLAAMAWVTAGTVFAVLYVFTGQFGTLVWIMLLGPMLLGAVCGFLVGYGSWAGSGDDYEDFEDRRPRLERVTGIPFVAVQTGLYAAIHMPYWIPLAILSILKDYLLRAARRIRK